MSPSRRGRPGLNLTELLVVIAIVTVLFGVFVVAVQKVRDDAARTQCTNNLKQIGLGVHNYAATYQNALPPLSCDQAKSKFGAYNSGLLLTLMPFIESSYVFQNAFTLAPQATWSVPIPPSSNMKLSAANPPLQTLPIKVFVCPADRTVLNGLSANQATTNAAAGVYPWAASSYSANYQLFGTVNNLPDDGATVTAERNNACLPKYGIATIPDGSSYTVMFGEQFAACGATAGNLWVYPGIGNYAANDYAPQPTGPAIVNAAGAPGSTTSRFWAPAFANSHSQFGFAGGGHAGSIYLHNTNAAGADPAPAQIHEPYAAGLYWDAPPQVGVTRWACDKSRLQSPHARAAQVAMGDGSTRGVIANVSQPTWYAVLKPDDGISPGADW